MLSLGLNLLLEPLLFLCGSRDLRPLLTPLPQRFLQRLQQKNKLLNPERNLLFNQLKINNRIVAGVRHG
jgi:hypothetical protein